MKKKLQLTIYVNEADRAPDGSDVPLHEAIARRLLHFDIAGATVTRGVMGFGGHHKLHRSRLFGVSDDRPMVIVAIDDESKIRPVLQEMRVLVARGGLMTLQEIEVV